MQLNSRSDQLCMSSSACGLAVWDLRTLMEKPELDVTQVRISLMQPFPGTKPTALKHAAGHSSVPSDGVPAVCHSGDGEPEAHSAF